MSYHLYDTNTNKIIWSAQTPYTVDGQPGVLPSNIVGLIDEQDPYPTGLLPYQTVEASQEVDVDNGKIYRRWTVVQQVPDEIPLWAFRSALVLANIPESTVADLIAGLPEPQKTVANIQWEYGNYIVRGHPLISSLGGSLGLTSQDIDNIFITASRLV
jgi:hypothetical protein